VFLGWNSLKIVFFWLKESLPWFFDYHSSGWNLDLQTTCHLFIFILKNKDRQSPSIFFFQKNKLKLVDIGLKAHQHS